MLRAGIVGLPNVGKSTLFNAIIGNAKAQAANFPFCTIEPNVGIVSVPDDRLNVLAKISSSVDIIPARVEFVDIAGLVKGASQGEGLGNKFLTNIREVDAIVHVVRCFEDDDIIHVAGSVDPFRDAEIINLELGLADLDQVQRRVERARKDLKTKKEAQVEIDALEKLIPVLDAGKPARSVGNAFVEIVRKIAAEENAQVVVMSAQVESELVDLPEADRLEFLESLGVTEGGLQSLIRATYDLLGLQTYFTTGPKETRAWTIHKGMSAPQAAAVIHSDFERCFIRAETVAYKDLIEHGSMSAAKGKGLVRSEGKEYVVAEGDVMLFLTSA
jgi:ribosome-binding ATPase